MIDCSLNLDRGDVHTLPLLCTLSLSTPLAKHSPDHAAICYLIALAKQGLGDDGAGGMLDVAIALASRACVSIITCDAHSVSESVRDSYQVIWVIQL